MVQVDSETIFYDAIVVGAGGGAKVYNPLTKQLDMKVALIEKGPIGGTCLNRGCIPSKMLIHAADVAQTIQEAEKYEVHAEITKIDFTDLVTRVSKTIDEDSTSTHPRLRSNPNLTWYTDQCEFVGPKTLRVGDKTITAKYIIIAAGARPTIPPIIGLINTPYMTSTEALRLTKQPKKLLVIGGGYIGCELGHYFSKLGTEVHMLVRGPRLLCAEDTEVSLEFTRVFSKRQQCHFNTNFHSVSYEDGEFTIKFSLPDDSTELSISGDQLLVAVGASPNTDILRPEQSGIEIDSKGYIKVDGQLRTTCDGVYAIGDIIGQHLFRHAVNFQAEYLVEHAFMAPDDEPIQYPGMPHAVFSSPQVAGIGETEEQLIARGASYVKGVNPYSSSAMGMALRSDSGFVKLLIEKGTRKILGCHIVGDEASVLIHQVIPLYALDATLESILYCIHIHPALSELVRNSARKARDALVNAGEKISLRLSLK
mmetsp:Transcript_45446/g.74068  ORF Transcript_45446/g.74068 Transcript_45446/m.74068 type:complete len:481 (-) Transcript_45446:39-1481(-)|eukprot:CAMPEP_0184675544 /NCGR_PEP_ID=MMETSP0308-20130426/87845_1 /TAXON_ID=38269 /ORGANISM="Gloeochaete witrockiana, Strain SAG 46.84" /LENGTH=480 /DNA_ID=CAMNT_0027123257 /DNA_START=103 /DNA_END=1545 /DNA_ORIENTATION=-